MLELPHTPDSVLVALRWGATPEDAPYSHHQIVAWCDRFWCHFMDQDAPAEIERLLPVLADVDVQWDIFVACTYTSEQLRALNLDDVRLPVEWFEAWLNEALVALER